MKLIPEFFPRLIKQLDKKYFPDVEYYRDNERDTNVHRTVELFNNGVLTYSKLIEYLSENCCDTKENIHKIVSKHIEDFEGFEYKDFLTNEEKQSIKILNFAATFDGILSEGDIDKMLKRGIEKFISKKRQHLVSITETAYPIRIKY